MTAAQELAQRYSAAMRRYLAGDGELALTDAYDVGRSALEFGLGPLVLFSIHRDLVDELMLSAPSSTRTSADVTAVFVEALAPFQMAYASLDEASAAGRQLTALIERHTDELRELRFGPRDGGGGPALLEHLETVIDRQLGELDNVRDRVRGVEDTAAARRRQVAEIVAAQEQERHRIAAEVHDDAVQAMTGVILRLALLRRSATDVDQAQGLNELEQSVSDAIQRLRRLIVGLEAPDLERDGLVPAVRAALQQVAEEVPLRVELIDELDGGLGPEAATVALRIVREALSNVRKHARASVVRVALSSSNGGVLADISDDGRGFYVGAAAEPGHLGLPVMRERAELVGGWLRVDSGPGGTTVRCWVPDAAGRAAEP